MFYNDCFSIWVQLTKHFFSPYAWHVYLLSPSRARLFLSVSRPRRDTSVAIKVFKYHLWTAYTHNTSPAILWDEGESCTNEHGGQKLPGGIRYVYKRAKIDCGKWGILQDLLYEDMIYVLGLEVSTKIQNDIESCRMDSASVRFLDDSSNRIQSYARSNCRVFSYPSIFDTLKDARSMYNAIRKKRHPRLLSFSCETKRENLRRWSFSTGIGAISGCEVFTRRKLPSLARPSRLSCYPSRAKGKKKKKTSRNRLSLCSTSLGRDKIHEKGSE